MHVHTHVLFGRSMDLPCLHSSSRNTNYSATKNAPLSVIITSSTINIKIVRAPGSCPRNNAKKEKCAQVRTLPGSCAFIFFISEKKKIMAGRRGYWVARGGGAKP